MTSICGIIVIMYLVVDGHIFKIPGQLEDVSSVKRKVPIAAFNVKRAENKNKGRTAADVAN